MNPNFYQLAKIDDDSFIGRNSRTSRNSMGPDDEDEDLEEEIDIPEEEFADFKDKVKEWLMIDDDILTLQKAIKDRKTKKVELTSFILDFMSNYKINDLNTNNGTIKYAKSMYTKPLNKTFLISKLGDFFKDLNKGEKVASFILNNRDKEEKCRLRRVIKKN
jgi:hypothetical protein